MTASDFLESEGLPARDPLAAPASERRFPDGGQYRIEIPSTEGPRALAAVLDEAAKRKVPVHRVSQGSGIMLMTDDEIVEMVEMGRQAGIEVNLFTGPRATFDIGAQAYSPAGRTLGLSVRGADQLGFALEDVKRAVRLGLRQRAGFRPRRAATGGQDARGGRAPRRPHHQDVGDDGAGESRLRRGYWSCSARTPSTSRPT